MSKNAIITGAISGAIAVALGAFGAHGLAEFLESTGREETYKTAVLYHFLHSLLLVFLGLLDQKFSIKLPFYLISTGIVLFSGSLYLLIFTGYSWLGIITPFGGISLIAGWLTLAYKARGMVSQ